MLNGLPEPMHLRGVVPVVLEGALGDDLAPVQVRIDPMDGDAVHLDAISNGVLDGMGALEGREQGRWMLMILPS